MKKVILYEVFKWLKSKPEIGKKIRPLIIISVVAFFLTAALALWAGVSMVQYGIGSLSKALDSGVAQDFAGEIKGGVAEMGFQPKSCWAKVESLISPEPWLSKPAFDNLKDLQLACFNGTASKLNENKDQSDPKQFLNNEGSYI